LAERGFQTELWTDPFTQGLTPEAKLLFIYLWTNKHCNQAGLYEISLKTMAFDTGLAVEALSGLLSQLEPKVTWSAEQNLVWVKNFLKRQCKSQSFLIAAAKCLSAIKNKIMVEEFIKYNLKFNLDLSPLCGHEGGTVVPPSHHGGTTSLNPVPVPSPVPDPVPVVVKEKGIAKGERKTAKPVEPEVAVMLSDMKAFLGYPEKTGKDPIPNYAREGMFLKKMLVRHFTRGEILSCWKSKAQQRRGEFVSMAWVNEDIAAYVESGRTKAGCRGEKPITLGQEGIAAMKKAGWSESEPDEPG
jgi:hypothetical protein